MKTKDLISFLKKNSDIYVREFDFTWLFYDTLLDYKKCFKWC